MSANLDILEQTVLAKQMLVAEVFSLDGHLEIKPAVQAGALLTLVLSTIPAIVMEPFTSVSCKHSYVLVGYPTAFIL